MKEQSTSMFEGLLRRYPAFRELVINGSVGWRPVRGRFIARLDRSCSDPTEHPSFVLAL